MPTRWASPSAWRPASRTPAATRSAASCPPAAPRVGVHLRAPGPDDDDRTARLGPLWYDGDEAPRVRHVAEVLADVRGESLPEMAARTQENAVRWLGI